MKQCATCLNFFPETADYFPRHKKSKNGLLRYCKPCFQSASRDKWREKHPQKIDDIPDGYKRCTACHAPKPAMSEYFWKNANGKYGLESRCKDCRDETRQTNKDSIKARQHDWYMLNRERLLHKSHDNKARHNILAMKRYHSDIEKHRAQHRAYARAHPEQVSRNRRKQYLKNRERYYTQVRNRKIQKKAIAGTHTPEQIKEQYDRQKGKCYYCHNAVKWGKHHVEHTFPISRVIGTDIPANAIDYLVIACKNCNLSKHDKFPWEWPEGGRLL